MKFQDVKNLKIKIKVGMILASIFLLLSVLFLIEASKFNHSVFWGFLSGCTMLSAFTFTGFSMRFSLKVKEYVKEHSVYRVKPEFKDWSKYNFVESYDDILKRSVTIRNKTYTIYITKPTGEIKCYKDGTITFDFEIAIQDLITDGYVTVTQEVLD